MRFTARLKTAALILSTCATPALSQDIIPLDQPSQQGCQSSASVKCTLGRGLEASKDLEASLVDRFNRWRGKPSRQAQAAPPQDLTTDEVYHAPLRINPAEPLDMGNMSEFGLTARNHMINKRWVEAEAAIALIGNPHEKEQIQVEYVEVLTEADLNSKALGYTNNQMASASPEVRSQAQMHVVASEIEFGDLQRAREVANGIPSYEIRNNALNTINRAETGLAGQVGSQTGSPFVDSAGQAIVTGATKVADGARTFAESPFIQRALADTHALTLPKSHPDRRAYEASKAARATGDMEQAIASANQISNRTLRRRAIERIFHTPKAQRTTGSLKKTFQPVSNAFTTLGNRITNSQ